MRIIIYEDASVIIDELQVDLSSGDNTVTFQAPGYIPGTLYVVSEHRYNVSESTPITVMKGDKVVRGNLIDSDNGSVSLSVDNQIITMYNYDALVYGTTEITLNIVIDEGYDNIQYAIPIVYTTNMISGDVRYFYDIAVETLTGELLIRSEMSEPLTANIGIGSTPLYSSLDTGDDILEYSLLGEYTLDPMSQTSIPLDNERVSDGVYALSRYIIDVENDETFIVLTLERQSGDDIRPPYPGVLIVLNNDIPVSKMTVDRSTGALNIGSITSLSVDSTLIDNDRLYVEITNNRGSDLPVTVIYDDVGPGLPSVQVQSPDNEAIGSSIERVDDEIQISFTIGGLGVYTVIIQ